MVVFKIAMLVISDFYICWAEQEILKPQNTIDDLY